MNDSNNKSGFTLAELLIVVAIIGVLVAISIPIFSSQLDKAREATDQANMRSAKAAAVAEWMTTASLEKTTYKYDAAKGTVVTDSIPAGYGKSNHSVDGASGIPNDGTAHYITVTVDTDGTVTMKWGGNDLSTAAGRKQEDIDTMHSIANALEEGFANGDYTFSKNYVQIAVFPDGTIAYYMDGKGNSEEDIAGIKKALENAGISTDSTTLNSTSTDNTAWTNGYLIHYEKKNGSISYKYIYANQVSDKTIGWNWWNNATIPDSAFN
ncbi:MAG: prepilin-type N-terminal cleavage/methylation domain-containing protein [Erysipelotrichaceae bacterium]|nr:prepilin-type N-terminal cleavage/methylation domain-containing protein [Erysipelotrichaceae bacterium]